MATTQPTNRDRRALAAILMLLCSLAPVHASAQVKAQSTEDLINFAFARYLGTGFYTTGDARIFVLQLPFDYELKPMTDDEYGLVLRLPVTVGITDVSLDSVSGGDIPGFKDVATLSLIPGIEYRYPVRDNWMLAPFFDYGLAHDIGNGTYIRVLGVGVKSFATFRHRENTITLGNRLLYADESRVDIEGNSNFAVFETGVDYRFHPVLRFGDYSLDFSLYYINYYYLKDLVILRVLDNPITLTNKNEIGFTFSLPEHSWLPENPRLGFGVQFGDDLRVYRIVFGMPFF